MSRLSREAYARLYGPTKGDIIRLGDTELLIEIEHDYAIYGHELVLGAGKNLRDGEGIDPFARPSDGILDIVIYGATIVDAVTGIIKADIGLEGRPHRRHRQGRQLRRPCPASPPACWSVRPPSR